ncbi:MAG TPA: capsule assembly Wzi family protein [Longimicrobiales bacterium]|nr:capsule assembly Wzi family protein [Longimicrobiales bacterium]
MRKAAFAAWTPFCAALMAPAAALGQAPDTSCIVQLRSADFVGPAAELARLIDLQDTTSGTSFVLRRPGRVYTGDACSAPGSVSALALHLGTDAARDGVRLLPAELLLVGHSAYPRDWNNGALWAGRGVNAVMNAGVELRWWRLSAAIAPTIMWQSNAEFDLQVSPDTSRSGFAHRWWGSLIDAPQRFGAESFGTIDAGQSYLRLDIAWFAAGMSNENIVWGPARRNPLLLSGTAPGFVHAFLETGRPVDIWIGDLDFQFFWGRLDESNYFDNVPENDRRVLAGVLVALQPRILEGLAIGGGRTQSFTWWPGLSLSEVLLRPYRGLSENPQGLDGGDNQLITMFFRWKSAAAGFEVYGEWAREDHWGTWTELLRNLDSSQAWGLGLQKLIRRGDNALRLSAEVTHLADALPSRNAGRGGPIGFYTNTSVLQGHTHRGQMLGAPIGPGAEALYIGGDYFWRGGRTSLSVERARYDDDTYLVQFASTFRAGARDAELSVRAGHLATLGSVSLDTELGWSMRDNRSFLGLDTIDPGDPYRRDHNLSARLGVRWTPPGSGR